MALPNAKDLVKLANACRKAGILTFKGDGIEFTLSEALPTPKPTKKEIKAAEDAHESIESEEPGYEQLLHWSVSPLDDEKADQ